MATEFKLPELGEGIDGGDVIEVLVKEGDKVDDGQTLLELETSKATIPVPAPQAGRIMRLHVKAGDHVKVGQTLVTFDKPANATADQAEDKETPQESPDKQGRQGREQQARSTRRASQNETVSVQRPSQPEPASPVSRPPSQPVPERVPARAQKSTPPEVKKPSPQPANLPNDEPAAAGPASRRLARELGVDIRQVPGSGRGGRITEEDVKAYVRSANERRQQEPESDGRATHPPAAVSQAPALPDFSRWGPIEREPLGSIRRKTAEHMSLAWSLIPHVTHCDEADISRCEEFRKRHADRIAASGAKLTVTAFALKAVALALKKFPEFNSTLDTATGELIVKRYYHIGVAVDTERGLLVPVIRDVDKKSLIDVAVDLGRVSERARQKKVTLDELQGGTFTITNVGGLGGTSFTPIVNYPEVAILGLARAREQQTVRDGRAENRLMLPLCLSFDHRVIDGAAAARFTRFVAELIEEPFLMML